MVTTAPRETNTNELRAPLWPANSTAGSHHPISYPSLAPPLPVLQRPETTVPIGFQLPTIHIILCYGELAPGWRITQPLLLTIDRDEDGYYIVSDDQSAVYGDGDTRVEALKDYIESLIDYYQLLAMRAESDPPTQALFHRLRSCLRPVVK
jgi:hypothetical protein